MASARFVNTSLINELVKVVSECAAMVSTISYTVTAILKLVRGLAMNYNASVQYKAAAALAPTQLSLAVVLSRR